MLDAVFLAFSDAVDVAVPARLVFRSAQGERTLPLPPSPEAREELSFGTLELPGLEVSYRPRVSIAIRAPARLFGGPLQSGEMELLLGDTVVLRGSFEAGDERVRLKPNQADIYLLRPTPNGDAAADRGQADGIAEMVLRRGEETVAVPLARWWIEHRTLDPSAACPPDWKPPLPAARLSNGLRPSGG